MSPTPGIRYFNCEGCGHEWVEPSRDAMIPSGDECVCGDWCFPRTATTAEYDRLWIQHEYRMSSCERKGLQEEVQGLRSAILAAGFGILKASNGYSIYDISAKALAEEARTTEVIAHNIELEAEVQSLRRKVSHWRKNHDDVVRKKQSISKKYGDACRERLALARAYDPNCDGYHFDEQLDAMRAAREVIESMQRVAEYLGRDPEGCLSGLDDDIIAHIESLDEPVVPGCDDPIHGWFNLTYAQYLVLPRSVLQSMPPVWQQKFVNLMDELDDTIDWRQDGYYVSLIQEGSKVDDSFADYQRGRRRIPHRSKS